MSFLMEYSLLFILGLLVVISAASIMAVIYLIKDTRRLVFALEELKRARIEIRAHPPLQATHKIPYEERLKAEYAKRGIPWETTGKS